MPRFQNSGEAVEKWAESLQVASHAVDLCDACSCDVRERDGRYPEWVRLENDEPKGTLEPADWHPDYSDEDYRCCFCSATLNEDDNDEEACESGPSWADYKREERCGFGLTGCTGIGTIRLETPKGDLIMTVCKSCDATDKGSIY